MQISTCDIKATMDVIRGKWKPSIITALKSGALGYGQLRRAIPNATKKVLTEHLRELEREGIISRMVIIERIIRVQYSLTDYGLSLVPLLDAMQDWGRHHRRLVPGVTRSDRNVRPSASPISRLGEASPHAPAKGLAGTPANAISRTPAWRL